MKVYFEDVKKVSAMKDLLDRESLLYVLRDTNNDDRILKARGQKSADVSWTGSMPIPVPGEKVAVSGTYGVVCAHGIKENPDTGQLEKSVWVKLKDGSLFKAISRDVAPLTDEVERQIDERHKTFHEAITKTAKKITGDAKKRRAGHDKTVSDMVDIAKELGLTIEEKTTFHKITGPKKGVAVYVMKNGGKVNLAGFCVEHPSVAPMTEEAARQRHLGSVRGQIIFQPGDQAAVEAFRLSAERLRD